MCGGGSTALNALPAGAPAPLPLKDWLAAADDGAPSMVCLHGRGATDGGAPREFLSALPAAGNDASGACDAVEVCLRLLVRQLQAVAMPGGLPVPVVFAVLAGILLVARGGDLGIGGMAPPS